MLSTPNGQDRKSNVKQDPIIFNRFDFKFKINFRKVASLVVGRSVSPTIALRN